MISFIKFYIIFITFVYFIFCTLFYFSFKRKTCHIVLFGSIGAGKSTFAKYLKEFLEKKGLKVYVCEELAIKHYDALAHYYLDLKSIKEKSFWFQSYLISKYENFYNYELKKFENNYDVVVHDRSYYDTYVFSKLNITNQKDLDFLDKECKKIKMYFDLTIYLNPGLEKCIEYKEKRDRQVEQDVDHNYLQQVFFMYEELKDDIYPNSLFFNSSINLNNYINVLQRMYDSGSFNNII